MKNTFIYTSLIAFFLLASCGGEEESIEEGTPSDAKLTTFKDSLSYAFGIEYAKSLFLDENFKGLDKQMVIKGFETNVSDNYPNGWDEVLKKLLGPNGQDLNTAYRKEGSEYIGKIFAYGFYKQMKGLKKISEFNISILKKGFSDFLSKKKLAISEKQKQNIMESFNNKLVSKIIASDAKLANDIDSLSYVLGVEKAKSIYSFEKNLFLDNEMAIKGFESNISNLYPEQCEDVLSLINGPIGIFYNMTEMEQISECIGKIIGYGFYKENQTKIEKKYINITCLKSGFSDFLLNKELALSLEDFRSNLKIKNKKLGSQMLSAAKKLKGAQVFDNGIVIQELKAGTGASPNATDDVQIEYVLKNAKGETIESTYDAKKMNPNQEPIAFNLAGVIPGWTFGLQKMKKGGKYKLFIPAEMAYGDQAPSQIGPGAALQFEIELLNFGKAGTYAAPMPQAPMNTGGGF